MKNTQQRLADAFLSLLEQRPYRRITVQDIVDECGLNRNSFYYHFSSIQDMIDTSCRNWTDEVIFQNAQPNSPVDCLRPIAKYTAEHRTALLKLYRSLPKDVLVPMLRGVTAHTVEQYFQVVTRGVDAEPARLALLTRFFSHMLLGAVVDYLENGMKEDPIAYAEALCSAFGDFDLASFLSGSPNNICT